MASLLIGSAKVLNIAHRGARAFAPENTLVAFAKAKHFGCDMFELDVRLSQDGEVVVYHDDHLRRCTDAEIKYPDIGSYQVADFKYEELRNLDAGSWYVEQLELPSKVRQLFLQSLTDSEIAEFVSPQERSLYASGEIRIPTLAETLQLANDLALKVNIELKSLAIGSNELVDSVIKIVHAEKMEDQILISSFEQEMLRRVRRQTKRIATALLVGCPLNRPLTVLRRLKARAYNLGCYKEYATCGFQDKFGKRYLAHIEKISVAGHDVNVWTCNDKIEMNFLLDAGVSGLITDYPNRVRDRLVNYFQQGQ